MLLLLTCIIEPNEAGTVVVFIAAAGKLAVSPTLPLHTGIYRNPCHKIARIHALKEKHGTVLIPSFTETGTQVWIIYNN